MIKKSLAILSFITLLILAQNDAVRAQYPEQEYIHLGQISSVAGPSDIVLRGIGLVAGLPGTGDKGNQR